MQCDCGCKLGAPCDEARARPHACEWCPQPATTFAMFPRRDSSVIISWRCKLHASPSHQLLPTIHLTASTANVENVPDNDDVVMSGVGGGDPAGDSVGGISWDTPWSKGVLVLSGRRGLCVCGKRASYCHGLPPYEPEFCRDCKPLSVCGCGCGRKMVDVVHNTCTDCDKQPSFALLGQAASHCADHRVAGEVDVKNKTCTKDGCDTRAYFALPGKAAEHCVTHREDGEVDVVHKLCTKDGCDTIPSFALPGKAAEHCVTHREDGEVDVVHKRCGIVVGDVACNKRADKCNKHKDARKAAKEAATLAKAAAKQAAAAAKVAAKEVAVVAKVAGSKRKR